MEKWEKTETYILIATLLLGGAISILDFTGLLENVTWLNSKIPSLTLLLVSLIATSLLVGTIGYRYLLKTLIPYGAIRSFDSDKESFEYMLRRIQEAKFSVTDITWENPYRATIVFDESDQERYFQAIEEVSKRVKYREIIMICGKKSRADKVVRLTSKAGKYYELSIYKDLPADSPPRTSFWIIDNEEVFLGKLSIRHAEVVDYFRQHYDDLWKNAIPIKMADTVNKEFIETLRKEFHQ